MKHATFKLYSEHGSNRQRLTALSSGEATVCFLPVLIELSSIILRHESFLRHRIVTDFLFNFNAVGYCTASVLSPVDSRVLHCTGGGSVFHVDGGRECENARSPYLVPIVAVSSPALTLTKVLGVSRHLLLVQATIVGAIFTRVKLRNNLGQVIHTYVPLSSRSITWYWSKDGDVRRLGR